MKPHLENKKEVDNKFVSKTITKFNDISKSYVKVIGIGKNNGQHKRALNNVHVSTKSEVVGF